ncbi:MAG: aldehyde dehydrogenase family protein [Vicinamibacterales bacterium]|nr:aldehyde dehydrogenase family protein [Acidobacteriota bacterium]MDP7473197.1 aldehyde dehydrogenase family protein [Vicinamibacterales bacterium]MDP7672924.1 aldehyde dehydrogenase family protein [Vicinamibacterales bacterium]HJO39750.1 aldehyde dehydrogenase family protein [Vicinamibacterales bacterium]
MRTLENFINGQCRAAADTARQPDINPADTTEIVAESPRSTAADAAAAVKAAERAYLGWRATPAPQRGQLLYRVQRRMEARRDELAEALTREEGKTLAESKGEVQRAINVVEFYAGEGRRLLGETIPSELPYNFCYTVREPIGPLALITPWNFPVAIPVWKLAPALACGNTVVLKPASLTPLSVALLADIFTECDAPPGILNVVYGSGRDVGEALLAHPAIRGVSFTGSNDIGSRLYGAGAARGIKCQCEMGGKNPIVVLDDADLELAVASAAQGAYGSSGQRCTATSRAIVVDAVADEFVERLEARVKSLVVGNGLDPATDVGPSVDETQMNTVLDYLAVGQKEGAQLVTGGTRLTGDAHDRGYFLEPTIFDRVTPDMRIAQEEIFGPVLSVLRVPDVASALSVANGVRYGLAASVYTRDVSRAFKLVDHLEAGIVHVNSPTVGGEAHIPFGGMKATGVGLREMGREAVAFYTELKVVYLDYTGSARAGNLY